MRNNGCRPRPAEAGQFPASVLERPVAPVAAGPQHVEGEQGRGDRSAARRSMLVPPASERGRSREDSRPKSSRPSRRTTISAVDHGAHRQLLGRGGDQLREGVREVDDLVGILRPAAALEDDAVSERKTRQRKPSHLGSKLSPSAPAGTSWPSGLASIGSIGGVSTRGLRARQKHGAVLLEDLGRDQAQRRVEAAGDVDDVLAGAAAEQRGDEREEQLVEQSGGRPCRDSSAGPPSQWMRPSPRAASVADRLRAGRPRPDPHAMTSAASSSPSGAAARRLGGGDDDRPGVLADRARRTSAGSAAGRGGP